MLLLIKFGNDMTYNIKEKDGNLYIAATDQKQYGDIGCDTDENILLEENDDYYSKETAVNYRPPITNMSLSKRKEGTTFKTNCDIDYSIDKKSLWEYIDYGFNKRNMNDEQMFEKIKRYYGIEMLYVVENRAIKVIDVFFKRENLDEKFKMDMKEKIKKFKNDRKFCDHTPADPLHHIVQYTVWEINGKYLKRQQKKDKRLLKEMQDVDFERRSTNKSTQKSTW